MRQAAILNTAVLAAKAASGMKDPNAPDMRPLHAYALERRAIDQERKLPTPEVLARKFGEISGQAFPYPSLAAAPERLQVFFVTFRAVIEALEPFRETDTAGEAEQEWIPPKSGDDSELARIKAATGIESNDELVDMAKVGTSLMAAIAVHTKQDGPLKGWTPAEDPAEIVGDLVGMLQDGGKPSPTEPTHSAQTTWRKTSEEEREWLHRSFDAALDKGCQIFRAAWGHPEILLFEGWPPRANLGEPIFHLTTAEEATMDDTKPDAAGVEERTKAAQAAMDEAAKAGRFEEDEKPDEEAGDKSKKSKKQAK